MFGLGIDYDYIEKRIRACDYLVVAQLFLQDNFLLNRPLSFADIKPRLLGHWGTCHGINVAYANLKAHFETPQNANAKHSTSANITGAANANNHNDYAFILGPGHGFPALQANLFLDGDLLKVDAKAQRNLSGLAYICKNFSWPGGFPSHASPITPGVICEGGELGYALATAYGSALGHSEKTVAVLIGDGELETATALSSLNLVKLLGTNANGKVLPILHLNGYKISAPTVYARKSERELLSLIRGFGYTPMLVDGEDTEAFQIALDEAKDAISPFIIMKTEKGATGPAYVHGQKVAGNFLAHQIPLKNAKTDKEELSILEAWLKSYNFGQLFNDTEGFVL